MSSKDIEYSEKYCDDYFEYRHVILPKELKPKHERLLSETEWRQMGVIQSRGWIHYMVHKPEPHILLFRRPVGTDSRTGKAQPNWIPPPKLNPTEIKKWLNPKQKQEYLQKYGNKM